MRAAYFSPMPPSTSGIADYSALLVPALGRLVDLEVIARPRRGAGRGADVALYHVGNNPDEHGWIVEELRERPGLVVLHEHVLHHLIAGITLVRGEQEAYRRAMQRDAGVVGRLLAHGVIDGVVPPVWETRPGDFPLCGEVLDHATALIVHSATVEDAARARGFAGAIHRIPHPAWPRPALGPDPALAGDAGPVFGAFGHLNRTKRVPQLVAAFARVLEAVPTARLVLVGSEAEDLGIGNALDAVEASHPGALIRIGHVDEQRLWNLIGGCDACICLRHPTMGETSGIAIRALVCGRPLIVSDVGWFSELPDDAALKVDVGTGEVDMLAQAMIALAESPERRQAMGTAATQAIAGSGVDVVAEAYRRALVDAAAGDIVRERVVAEVAAAAAAVGIGADDEALRDIAVRIARSGL